MTWDYLEALFYQEKNKAASRQIEQWRQEARDQGITLVDHELTNCFPDEFGNSTFDRIVIRNFDTGEVIAEFKEGEIDRANKHYMEGNYFHGTCYMP